MTQGFGVGWESNPPALKQSCFLSLSTLQPWGLFLSFPFYLLCQSHVRLENAVVFAL